MKTRAYKFRIYPSKIQQKKLASFFGAKRFAWNKSLAWRSDVYKTDAESVTGVDFSRELTWLKNLEPYAWLKDVPSTVLTQGLRDQDNAFKRFFKEGAGYPKFKNRYQPQAIRFQMDQRVVMNSYRPGKLLKLTGLGAIEVRWSREPKGVPKMVSLSKDAAGRYFVSMGIDEEIEKLPVTQKSVGIDLGVLTSLTLSDGVQIGNPRFLAREKIQLKKLQQRLSRQKKTSNRRAKTKFRIGKLHTRIADCRREYLHQTTSRIINENQVIMIENLFVKGMTSGAQGTKEAPGKQVAQKSGLNRSILDVSFGEIVRQLEYKADWYGRTLIKVDRFFPSSKLCSDCGHKLDELRLDSREWTCPKCGAVHDRDINAAINIQAEGLKQLDHVTRRNLGKVRDSGNEGACSMIVSPRKSDQPSAGLEPA